MVAEWRVQIVIASPLRRALQTACLAFEQESTPVMAWPVVTEFFGEYPECKGRNLQDLRQDPILGRLSRFSQVNLDNVTPAWWLISNDTWRLHTFLSWLRNCPETRVCVVCHWGFIHHLMKLVHCAQELAIHNCGWVESVWHRVKRPLPEPAARSYAVWLLPVAATNNTVLSQLTGFMAACKDDPVLAHSTLVTRSNAQLHISLSEFIPLGSALLAELCVAIPQLVSAAMVERGHSWHVSPQTLSLHLDTRHHTTYFALKLASGFLQSLTRAMCSIPGVEELSTVIRSTFSTTILVDDRPTGCLSLNQWEHLVSAYPLLDKLIQVRLQYSLLSFNACVYCCCPKSRL